MIKLERVETETIQDSEAITRICEHLKKCTSEEVASVYGYIFKEEAMATIVTPPADIPSKQEKKTSKSSDKRYDTNWTPQEIETAIIHYKTRKAYGNTVCRHSAELIGSLIGRNAKSVMEKMGRLEREKNKKKEPSELFDVIKACQEAQISGDTVQ